MGNSNTSPHILSLWANLSFTSIISRRSFLSMPKANTDMHVDMRHMAMTPRDFIVPSSVVNLNKKYLDTKREDCYNVPDNRIGSW